MDMGLIMNKMKNHFVNTNKSNKLKFNLPKTHQHVRKFKENTNWWIVQLISVLGMEGIIKRLLKLLAIRQWDNEM